ncbi:response regulator, partial [Pantoea endophytica]
MPRFIIVDDHPIARIAIKLLLEKHGHSVIAECGDGEEAVTLVSQLKPDMLIVDIDIPTLNGIEVIKAIRRSGRTLPIIVMSGKNIDYYASQSAKAGANGFISKANNLDDLVNAVNTVRNGYGYFPLNASNTLFENQPIDDSVRLKSLSAREFEVLQYLGQGMEVITIATRMKISNKTVSTFKSRLMPKLELKNRKE